MEFRWLVRLSPADCPMAPTTWPLFGLRSRDTSTWSCATRTTTDVIALAEPRRARHPRSGHDALLVPVDRRSARSSCVAGAPPSSTGASGPEWAADALAPRLRAVVDGEVVGTQSVIAERLRRAPRGRLPARGSGRRTRAGASARRCAPPCSSFAFAGLGAEYALTGAWHDNAASLGVTRSLGYVEDGRRRATRRDAPDWLVGFRLARCQWEARRRDDITIEGLEPCLDRSACSRAARRALLEGVRMRAATACHLVVVGVALAGPEEAAQPVLASAGHDVHVQVRHALADHVVHGHERCRAASIAGLHGARHPLHRRRRAGRARRRRGRAGCRRAGAAPRARDRGTPADVEERDDVGVVEHDAGRLVAGDDAQNAQRAARHRQRCHEAQVSPHGHTHAYAPLAPDDWDAETTRQLGHRGITGPGRLAAQHLRHHRQPPEAAEAVAGVRQPRAVEEHAVAPRPRAADPAHRLAVPQRVRVGPARDASPAACGITDDEIDRVTAGPTPPGGIPSRRTLLAPPTSCTPMPSSPTPPGRRWPSATTIEQLLDAVFAVGQYHTGRVRARTAAACRSTPAWRGSRADGSAWRPLRFRRASLWLVAGASLVTGAQARFGRPRLCGADAPVASALVRVTLFVTCVVDVFAPDVGVAAVKVLRAAAAR